MPRSVNQIVRRSYFTSAFQFVLLLGSLNASWFSARIASSGSAPAASFATANGTGNRSTSYFTGTFLRSASVEPLCPLCIGLIRQRSYPVFIAALALGVLHHHCGLRSDEKDRIHNHMLFSFASPEFCGRPLQTKSGIHASDTVLSFEKIPIKAFSISGKLAASAAFSFTSPMISASTASGEMFSAWASKFKRMRCRSAGV